MQIISNIDTDYKNIIGDPDMSIAEAMTMIDILGVGILFFIDGDGTLKGCVTDGDIRRWLLKNGTISSDVSGIINQHPMFLDMDHENEALSCMAANKLRAIPVVDEKKRIVRVYFNSFDNKGEIRSNDSLKDIPVVIMAGGAGTRLYPYTKVLPKPLIPIGDRPIIDHIIQQFGNFGCRKYYAILNYKKKLIKAYFSENEDEKNYDISFVDEDHFLDTGGGLSLIRDYIDSTFILTNCDILIKEDFSKIIDYHREHENYVTIVSSVKKSIIPYGVIELGEEGTVAEIVEKPEIPYLANTGCYIIESDLICAIGDKEKIGFPDIIRRCQANGKKIGAYPISEYAWLDMGQYDTMEEMERRLSQDRYE